MTRTHTKQRGNSKSGMVKVRVRNVPSTQRANNPTQPHVTHVESVKSLTEAVLNVQSVMQGKLVRHVHLVLAADTEQQQQ